MGDPSTERVAAWFGHAKPPPSIAGWLALDRIRHRLFAATEDPIALGRYRLGARLGAGGCGTVFAAHDPLLDREVAVKVLHDPGPSRGRLREEARALAALHHPHVARLFDFDEAVPQLPGEGAVGQAAVAFVVMERIDGVDLQRWIAGHGRDAPTIVALVLQAADALAAAHDVGIVHRDVKPANLLVDRDPTRAGAPRVRVVDFGMAGTPHYMAPEQHDRVAVDGRADQFALAVTMSEALTGSRPFAGADLEALARAKRSGVVAWPGADRLGAPLRAVIARALQPDPQARFADMRAFADALGRSVRVPGRPAALVRVASIACALGLGTLVRPDVAAPSEPAAATVALQLSPRLAVAGVLEGARRYDEAIAIADAAIHETTTPADLARWLARRGSARLRKGDIAPAQTDLARAYFLAADGGDHPTAARAAVRMAVATAAHADRPVDALGWTRHAAAALARIDAAPIDTGGLAYARGIAFARLGLLPAAHDELDRAVALWTDRDPHRAAFAAVELGNADLVAHDPVHAEIHYTRALAFVGDRADDPELAVVLERLGSARTHLGRLAEARASLQQAFRIRASVLGRDHVEVAIAAHNLAFLETRAGDHAAAERWFDRAVLGFTALGPASPQLALALDGRGTARQNLRRDAAAVVDHEAALAILERTDAVLDPRQRAVTAAHAATALARVHAWTLAVARAQQGIEAAASDSETRRSCLATQAEAAAALGDHVRARRLRAEHDRIGRSPASP